MPFISGPSGSDGINIDTSQYNINSFSAISASNTIPSGVPIECIKTLYEVNNGTLNFGYSSTKLYPKTICVLENGLVVIINSTHLRVLKYVNDCLQLVLSSNLPTNLQDNSTYENGIDIHSLDGDKAIIVSTRTPNITASIISVTESSVTYGTVYTYTANISSFALMTTKLNNSSILVASKFSSDYIGVSVISINNTVISFSTPVNTEFTYLSNIESLNSKYVVLIYTTYAILLTISNGSVSVSSRVYYIVSDYTSYSGVYSPFVTDEKLYLFMTPSGSYNTIVGLYCYNGSLKETNTYLYPTSNSNSDSWYPNGEYTSSIDNWRQYGVYKINDHAILITYFNTSSDIMYETTFRHGVWKRSTGDEEMMMPFSQNSYASTYGYNSCIMITHDTMLCFNYSSSSSTVYRIIKIRPTVRRAGYRIDGISTSNITPDGGTCVLL